MQNQLVLSVAGNVELSHNLEALEAYVRESLKKYDIAVTADGVVEAKNLRAEINKGKKAIMDAWKVKKAEILEPITQTEARLKEIYGLCDEAMLKIDEQVKKFEAGRRAEALRLCEEYRDFLCKDSEVEASMVSVAGFDNLTYITSSGALSKSGKDAVQNVFDRVKAQILEEKLRMERLRNEIKNEVREEVKEQVKEEIKNEIKTSGLDNPIYQDSFSTPSELRSPDPMPTPAPAGKKFYRIKVEFMASAPIGAEGKIKELFLNEINKSEKLSQALQDLEVL